MSLFLPFQLRYRKLVDSSDIPRALRLSHGVAQRLPCTLSTPLAYDSKYTIPPFTPFSQSAYLQHHSPQLFANSHVFDPSRFLTDKNTINTQLERFLVPFRRGTRMCLGMNLAWAELYIGLANVFRRIDFEM